MSTKKTRRVVRKDPPTRTPDGSRPWGKLINPDPGMHYVYANPSDELEGGVSYYENLGYEQVVRTEGGVRSAVSDKTEMGSKVTTLMGQVLMQIPKGDPRDPQPGTKAALDAPGQAHVDALEQRILKKGGIDGLRGFHGVEFVNETEKNREVTLHG